MKMKISLIENWQPLLLPRYRAHSFLLFLCLSGIIDITCLSQYYWVKIEHAMSGVIISNIMVVQSCQIVFFFSISPKNMSDVLLCK